MHELKLFYLYNMKNLFSNLKENEVKLINEVLGTSRKNEDGTVITWGELAEKYYIRPQAETRKQRVTAANDVWRKFLKKVNSIEGGLEVVKQTFNGTGELLFETKKKSFQELEYSTEGMIIDKITTNPSGGEWITYKNVTTIENTSIIENTLEKLFEKYSNVERVIDETSYLIKEIKPNSIIYMMLI